MPSHVGMSHPKAVHMARLARRLEDTSRGPTARRPSKRSWPMSLSRQMVIYDVKECGEDDKEPCSICGKPVKILFLVGIGDSGAQMMMCQAHMVSTAKVQARAAHAVREDAPLFAGSNDRAS